MICGSFKIYLPNAVIVAESVYLTRAYLLAAAGAGADLFARKLTGGSDRNGPYAVVMAESRYGLGAEECAAVLAKQVILARSSAGGKNLCGFNKLLAMALCGNGLGADKLAATGTMAIFYTGLKAGRVFFGEPNAVVVAKSLDGDGFNCKAAIGAVADLFAGRRAGGCGGNYLGKGFAVTLGGDVIYLGANAADGAYLCL